MLAYVEMCALNMLAVNKFIANLWVYTVGEMRHGNPELGFVEKAVIYETMTNKPDVHICNLAYLV